MTNIAHLNSGNSAATKLCTDNLDTIGNRVKTPQYDRAALGTGIVHMSVGGFHRAHQAVYVDEALELNGGDWMICGVGLMPQDDTHVATLTAQDTLYTVLERSPENDSAYVVGSMKECLHAPSDPAAVLAKLADPSTKIVSLTITEKGYCYDENGDLSANHPAVQKDLQNPDAPQTAMGYLLRSLRMRHDAGTGAYTIMCCDNLPGNGDLTKKILLQYAKLADAELTSWIEDNVTFPNAMVDRITPVTTPEIVERLRSNFGVEDGWPVICEDFRQWVLEDKFVDGARPALEDVGVQLVEDVEPYEKMKVRLLNGSHSALSYLSYLMGYRNVDEAMADKDIKAFVRAYMDHDITPTVPDVPGIDLDEYKDTLIARFANPGIRDQVQRLAEDGSTKIPNAILPCIRKQIASGGSYKYAALALAGWFRYLRGIDEEGQPIEIKDPRADILMDKAKLDTNSPVHILGIAEIFDDLGTEKEFVEELSKALNMLNEKGARKTILTYLG